MVYSRMLLVMGVNLYISRVILDVIGITDYGIYNLVSGIVILFSFLNNVMSTATQRFISYDLGCNDITQLKKTFSMSMSIHIGISIIVFFICETIGVYLLNTHMDIPKERIGAANWVFQISILNCCSKFIRVPYNACIIAYERMNFFAYIGILEVILGLVSVYLLYLFIGYDLLILYTLLLFISSVIIFIIYKKYCNKKLNIGLYSWFWDKSLFKSLTSFSGWSMFGGMANLASQQGLNMLLNVFYGVVVNAAMGIATQVSNGVYSLVSSFQTAFVPQLVKLYARKDFDNFIKLIIRTSKFSFYLIYIFALPIIINMDYILNIWLIEVPKYTKSFCIMMVIFGCIDALSSPLWNSIQATGKIKTYQIVISLIILMTLPLAYVMLRCGCLPQYVLMGKVMVNMLTHFTRIILLKNMIRLPVRSYLHQTLFLPIIVVIISLPVPIFLSIQYNGLKLLLLSTLASVVIISISVVFIGCTKVERSFMMAQMLKIIRHA